MWSHWFNGTVWRGGAYAWVLPHLFAMEWVDTPCMWMAIMNWETGETWRGHHHHQRELPSKGRWKGEVWDSRAGNQKEICAMDVDSQCRMIASLSKEPSTTRHVSNVPGEWGMLSLLLGMHKAECCLTLRIIRILHWGTIMPLSFLALIQILWSHIHEYSRSWSPAGCLPRGPTWTAWKRRAND